MALRLVPLHPLFAAEASGVDLRRPFLQPPIRRRSLQLDLGRVTLEAGCAIEMPLHFRNIYIPSIELYDGMKDCSNLGFHDCYF